jgi:sugar transferase (PEP-CTERM/EpsH1 system associated)
VSSPRRQVEPPLVVHIIHHLAMGGLENGIINLINRMPPERYRHAIVCLSHYTDFAQRLERRDVPVIALHKQPGKDPPAYFRLWRTLRRLRPSIVHGRNLAAVDTAPVSWAAGVRCRIHGEHGWDIFDLYGQNRRYRLLRRICSPFVTRYTCVSSQLAQWLANEVGIAPTRIRQIYNGVDTQKFRPDGSGRQLLPENFREPDRIVIGNVGRMQPVKDPLTLVRAFGGLLAARPEARQRLRLVMVGDGPIREDAQRLSAEMGFADVAWFPGQRDDVPEMLRAIDLFVLPSLNEGTSNTILEAMASGRAVVATAVGGNPELVEDGKTGRLVAAGSDAAMQQALREYVTEPALLRAHGEAGRRRAERDFSLSAMVDRYLQLYDEVLSTGRERHRWS